MKKELNEILDTLTATELDSFPEQIFDAEAPDDVTLKRLQDTVLASLNTNTEKRVKRMRKKLRIPTIAAVAGILLLIGISVGSYAYAAEQKEYKKAIHFFEENNLSTEGLSKHDIKAIYRDITTNTFSYSKTAEVIEKSDTTLTIPGYELPKEPITDASIEDVLERADAYLDTLLAKADAPYTKTNTLRIAENILLTYGSGFSYVGKEETKENAKLTATDNNGNVLWEHYLNNGFNGEAIISVLPNSDGTFTVFIRGAAYLANPDDHNNLCVNRYDSNGTLLQTQRTKLEDYYQIRTIKAAETGYLVVLYSPVQVATTKVLKLDTSGTVTGTYFYHSPTHDYYIADVIEYNGNIYISGYTTPIPDADIKLDRMRETLSIKAKASLTNPFTEEEATALFRENYTAVLLLCEPQSGTPVEFCTVSGGLGSHLYTDNGILCWYTEDIVSVTHVVKNEGNSHEFHMSNQYHVYAFDTGSLRAQKPLETFNTLVK